MTDEEIKRSQELFGKTERLEAERTMRNRIRCRKCGDIIESKTRHDYVTCKCGAVAVDGGSSYLKRTGDPADIEELEEWPKDPKDMCGNE
jgi:hypothetical protein